MKKLLLVPVLAMAMLTGGCGPDSKALLDTTVQQVINYARDNCNYVADSEAVRNVLAALTSTPPGLVGLAGNLICGAVQRRSGASGPVVRVSGQSIPVTGHFVSRPR